MRVTPVGEAHAGSGYESAGGGPRLALTPTAAFVQATWNGVVLASSSHTLHIDGAVYFPPDDVVRDYLTESTRTSVCLCNGRAHFLHLTVNGVHSPDAAWHWPPPSPLSRHLPGHIAFGPDVVITEHPAR